MLSISGRTRTCVIVLQSMPFSSVSLDLCYTIGRVCQHVCACIVCFAHCKRSSLASVGAFQGRIHSRMKITGLALSGYADMLIVYM